MGTLTTPSANVIGIAVTLARPHGNRPKLFALKVAQRSQAVDVRVVNAVRRESWRRRNGGESHGRPWRSFAEKRTPPPRDFGDCLYAEYPVVMVIAHCKRSGQSPDGGFPDE